MKFSLFLLLTTCLLCLDIQAQTDSSHGESDGGYVVVSTMPVFSGGDDVKFVQYVVSYVKENTPQLKKSAVKGNVFIQFTIETDSSVSTASIVPGKGINPTIDQSVIDAVKKSRWSPGTLNGKATRAKRTMRITFS
ncbi:MAG: energy transducer TonB [Cytophaga sp.]|uniref:energy transducer TonB n=1 Tax=Cytophaga sp. TaxID=29535 RepID=UPI003F821614